jgi:hypothetical protein
MSEFVTSLNDRTADDEPAKKKPKTLSGYFEIFDPNNHVQVAAKIDHSATCLVPADLCNPGQDTLLTSIVSESSYLCMSVQVADHCFHPRSPSDEKVGHSAFISTRSVIPAVRRTGRTFQFVVISSKWTDTHEPFHFLRYFGIVSLQQHYFRYIGANQYTLQHFQFRPKLTLYSIYRCYNYYSSFIPLLLFPVQCQKFSALQPIAINIPSTFQHQAQPKHRSSFLNKHIMHKKH